VKEEEERTFGGKSEGERVRTRRLRRQRLFLKGLALFIFEKRNEERKGKGIFIGELRRESSLKEDERTPSVPLIFTKHDTRLAMFTFVLLLYLTFFRLG
jgi:hypothetical protein